MFILATGRYSEPSADEVQRVDRRLSEYHYPEFNLFAAAETSSSGWPTQSLPSEIERQGNGKNSKWSKEETKILIHAYKNNYKQLGQTKSARGKKSVWDKIHTEFSEECFMADLGTEQQKSQAQVKEKWKSLF